MLRVFLAAAFACALAARPVAAEPPVLDMPDAVEAPADSTGPPIQAQDDAEQPAADPDAAPSEAPADPAGAPLDTHEDAAPPPAAPGVAPDEAPADTTGPPVETQDDAGHQPAVPDVEPAPPPAETTGPPIQTHEDAGRPPAIRDVAPGEAPADGTSIGQPAPPVTAAPPAAGGAAADAPPLDLDTLVAQAAVAIDWRVENPFRFFADPQDTEVHRATYLSLSPDQRQASPVLAAEHALSRRHEEGWAETMYRKTCWNDTRNRYLCADKGDYINPDGHRVVVTLKGAVEREVDCLWISKALGGAGAEGPESRVTQPCGEPLTLMAPYPAGLAVSVQIGGREVAATEIKVRDIFVVGIGDSFGSGEGNPDVPVRFSPERTITYGTAGGSDLSGYPARVGPWKQVGDAAFIEENARWLDQACHRSLYSYQLRTALELAVEDPHRAVTYAGFACSGAEVTWGLFLRYKGNEWVPHPPDLSQISATADAQCGKAEAPLVDMPEAYHMNGVIPELQGGVVLNKCPPERARKIDLLLMSVGGNDIGFARLVANAVLADDSLVRSLGGWFGQVHGNRESQELLSRLDKRYKAMNRALHGILHIPWDESDRIILTAYPPFALLDDAGTMCPDGNAGMEVFNEFSISQKAALSSSWLADKLDRVMAASAKSFGWSFVWDHRKAFVGRGLCAGRTDGLGPLADDLRLPRRRNGVWVPYNPINFQPYAARERWFRTPNDAFMTANFHAAGSVLQKVLKLQGFSWFQVLLASTYSGAFHPTAEGQAAIADAVVARARKVLAHHGQQSAAALSEAR